MNAEHKMKTELPEIGNRRAEALMVALRSDEDAIWQKAFNEVVEILTERDSLRDRAALFDWLEKNGSLEHLYEEAKPETTVPAIRVNAFNFDFEAMSIAEAITKAISNPENK